MTPKIEFSKYITSIFYEMYIKKLKSCKQQAREVCAVNNEIKRALFYKQKRL